MKHKNETISELKVNAFLFVHGFGAISNDLGHGEPHLNFQH